MKTHYTLYDIPACGTLGTFHAKPIITTDVRQVDCKRCLWHLSDGFPKGDAYSKAREKNKHLKQNSAAFNKRAALTKGAE